MSITYHRINLEDVIAGLKDFLCERPDILIAFVFGSATRRNLVRDLDIAVYFKGVPDPMEVCRLIVELEDSIGLPVDVIPLNEAPPKL
ncbi:MAG: nucleotidyltransferase domain-containing protein, partial [Nitrososphaerota archaeon]|nr:nucleotidyltransferase domain-containing protein [Nitrososphaerota archaeon]